MEVHEKLGSLRHGRTAKLPFNITASKFSLRV